MSEELIVIEREDALKAFTDEQAFDAMFQQIKTLADQVEVDLSTDKGRKAHKSFCFRIRKTKARIDDVRKDLTEDMRKKIAAINARGGDMVERLEVLHDDVRKPLTDWEVAEKLRVETIRNTIEEARALGQVKFGETSVQIQERISKLPTHDLDWYAEFKDEADLVIQAAFNGLIIAKTAAVNAEKEAAEREQERAELARLKKAEEERQAREKAAEEERKAEEARREQEKREADEKAAAEREEAERKQSELQRQLDEANRKAAEAEKAADANRRALADDLIKHIKNAANGFIDGVSYPLPMLLHEVEVRALRDMEGCGEHAVEVEAARQTALVTLKEAIEKAAQEAQERAERAAEDERRRLDEERAAEERRAEEARELEARQVPTDVAIADARKSADREAQQTDAARSGMNAGTVREIEALEEELRPESEAETDIFGLIQGRVSNILVSRPLARALVEAITDGKIRHVRFEA